MTNYSELISQLLVVIGLAVVLVNIMTEVAKKIYNFKSAQDINTFVTVLSIIITMCTMAAYCQVNNIAIHWYCILAFIVIGFMVAYAAMFGFDKLLKYFEGFKQ